MRELVSQVLHSNQFASGGLLLMVIGAIGAWARKWPAKLWGWFLRQISITVTVKDDDAVFGWIKFWFSTQKFAHKTRYIDLDTSLTGEVLLLPAPGSHWFWYKHRLFNVEYTRDKMQNSSYSNQRRIESFSFWVIGRNRNIIKSFVEDITRVHRERVKEIPHLYQFEGSYWEQVIGYEPRKLDTVILPADDKEKLLADIQKFHESKERYKDLGIPYHRGYLLYGPPGTGKSSLAAAIAGHLNMALYVINLNEFNDRILAKAINLVGKRSVILFEDIDAMTSTVSRPMHRYDEGEDEQPTPDKGDELAKRFGVTLSGLLNALDGVDAPSDVVYIMTTNREIQLDPALIRPGRIDYRLHMGEATLEQKMELAEQFFPEMPEYRLSQIVTRSDAKTMAEFQGELLQMQHEEEQEEQKLSMVGD